VYELTSETYYLRKKYKKRRQQLLDNGKEQRRTWNWREEAPIALCAELTFEKGLVLSQDILRN
jgi:hypothetical protein